MPGVNVEPSCPWATSHVLVASPDRKIDVHALDIDRQGACSVIEVYQYPYAMRLGRGDDRIDLRQELTRIKKHH